jgi:hypothetical protein
LNDPKAPIDWFKVDGVDALVELALNLHWSWNHAADELWEALDKELWGDHAKPMGYPANGLSRKNQGCVRHAGVPPEARQSASAESGILSGRRLVPA